MLKSFIEVFKLKNLIRSSKSTSESSSNKEIFDRISNCQESWNFENWNFQIEDIVCLVCKLNDSETSHSNMELWLWLLTRFSCTMKCPLASSQRLYKLQNQKWRMMMVKLVEKVVVKLLKKVMIKLLTPASKIML